MLPKVKRVLFSFLFLIPISTTIFAQAPTSADIMRDRISKAKAHLVVKNYSAAIYDLENIRRETNDRALNRAINILLMHAYLEQGDYKRTQKFLNELFKSKKAHAATDYLAIAGQVVSGAKTQLKRYQVLGLNVSDEKLPSYAVEDLEQMRKTLELIVKQSKVIGKDKRLSRNSLALLEETSNARGNIARDDFDEKRWKNEIVYARQQIASSGSTIINAVDDTPINAPDPNIVAAKVPVVNVEKETVDEKPVTNLEGKIPTDVKSVADAVKGPEKEKVVEKPIEKPTQKIEKKNDTLPLNDSPRPKDRPIRIIGGAAKTVAKEDKDFVKSAPKPEKTPNKKLIPDNVAAKDKAAEDGSPLPIGALVGYATKRVNPIYPRQARTMRMSGVVKVKLVVGEDGKVAKVEKAEGPSLLKRAARDAIRKWKFRPFTRDGRPVKATGFVNFNFNLL